MFFGHVKVFYRGFQQGRSPGEGGGEKVGGERRREGGMRLSEGKLGEMERMYTHSREKIIK